MVFVDVILPVALIAALGYALGRTLRLEPHPVAAVSLYVLSPALVVSSLARSTVGAAEAAQIVLFSLALAVALTAMGVGVANWFGLDPARRGALLLSSVFMNAGNYGMPVVLFTLGPEALARAVVFVVIQGFLMYSLGVAIASQGRDGGAFDARRAVRAVLAQPAFYASAVGVLLRALGDRVPEALLRPVDMLGEAAIPMSLVVLGLQLSRVKPSAAVLRDAALAGTLRLVASPLLAAVIARFLNLPELTARVLIVEAAMPSAVVATLLAVRFDALPEVVSSTTLLTTLASLLTVTVMLVLMA